MPLPKPRTGEQEGAFVDRCMGDDVMVEEYPDAGQRRAVCETQWGKGKGQSREERAEMQRSWYEIRAQKSEADIYIYDEIGAFGISASAFVKDLNAIKAPRVNLYINSPGGDLFDSIAMFNALQRHPAAIRAEVDGLAASAASVIVQAAADRQMANGSALMIHEPEGFSHGNSEEMDKAKELLDSVGVSIAGIYAERAGGEAADWRGRMQEETWYSAQGAVDAGLADGIAPGARKPAPGNRAPAIFNLTAFKSVPKWFNQAESKEVTGMENLEEIRRALDVGDDADILETIEALKARSGDEEAVSDEAIRAALGIEPGDDILEAIKALTSPDPSSDGEGIVALRRANATLDKKVVLLEGKIEREAARRRQEDAQRKVDEAIVEGRILPKLRSQALKLALNDPADFEAWVQTLPKAVPMGEIGTNVGIIDGGDDQINMAELEPTPAEMQVGKAMGLTRIQLIAQKARDRGIDLPERLLKGDD